MNTFFPTMPSSGSRIKRFYKKVDVVEHPLGKDHIILPKDSKITFDNLSLSDKYWGVALDGKVIKTIFKDNLLCPTKALAVALAEEWESQHDSINIKALHLVSLIMPIIFIRLTT